MDAFALWLIWLLVITLNVRNLKGVQWFLWLEIEKKGKGAKKPQEESGHLDESWGSAGRTGDIEEGDRQEQGRLVSVSCSLICMCVCPCVCVCAQPICALVLEELNRGSYQMDTHTHTNDRFHPLASCNHNSAVLPTARYTTNSFLTCCNIWEGEAWKEIFFGATRFFSRTL